MCFTNFVGIMSSSHDLLCSFDTASHTKLLSIGSKSDIGKGTSDVSHSYNSKSDSYSLILAILFKK